MLNINQKNNLPDKENLQHSIIDTIFSTYYQENYYQSENSNENYQSFEKEEHSISPDELVQLLENNYIKHQQILNSSKNQDIVVVIGPTGAGKSTLLNLLCHKNLIAKNGNILLQNQHDTNSFKIGSSNHSETLFPQHLSFQDVNFYDMAGSSDTRGSSITFLNAILMKNILELAKSVKIIFVVEYGQLMINKGQEFADFIKKTANFLPDIDLAQSSLLIITKMEQRDSDEEFKDIVKNFFIPISKLLANPFLDALISHNQILKISKPSYKQSGIIQINQERDAIWENLIRIKGTPTPKVNIETYYTYSENQAAQTICDNEMRKTMELILSKYNIQKPENIEELIALKNQFFEINEEKTNFIKKINSNHLILLLKPLFENILNNYTLMYQYQLSKTVKSIQKQIQNYISQYEEYESYKQLQQQNEIVLKEIAQKQNQENMKQIIPISDGIYRIFCCDNSYQLLIKSYEKNREYFILQSTLLPANPGIFFLQKCQGGYTIKVSNKTQFIPITSRQGGQQGLYSFSFINQNDSTPQIFKIRKLDNHQFNIYDTQHQKYWKLTQNIKNRNEQLVSLSSTPSNFAFIKCNY